MGLLDRLVPRPAKRRVYRAKEDAPVADPGPAAVRGHGKEMATAEEESSVENEDGVLPDPALPPARRGTWNQAALTNIAVSELVKRQIGMGGGLPGHDRTIPQEK